jgi:hypothetical protein
MKFTLDTDNIISLFDEESEIELKFELAFKVSTATNGEYEMKIPFYLNPQDPKILIKRLNYSTAKLEIEPINFDTFVTHSLLKNKKFDGGMRTEIYGHTSDSMESWELDWHLFAKGETEQNVQDEIKAGIKTWFDENGSNILNTLLLEKDKINNMIVESIDRLRII